MSKALRYVSRQQTSGKFAISIVPESCYDQVIEFMAKFFYPKETICRNLNLWTDGIVNDTMHRVLTGVLKQGLSLMAVDRTTNKLVGTMTNCIHTASSRNWMDGILTTKYAVDPNWKIFSSIHSVRVDIARDGAVYQMDELTILPDYNGMGLGKQLLRISDDLGVEVGYEIYHSTSTTEATYFMLKKLGFQTYYEFPLKTFTYEGRPLSRLDNPEAKIRIMFKKARKIEQVSP